ncbi:MAG: ORF6N domain-containing protein [Nanoarchaeota archaeon]
MKLILKKVFLLIFMEELSLISDENIKNKIYNIRGVQVMIDNDLAKLYGVETKRLNEVVKRKFFKIKFL